MENVFGNEWLGKCRPLTPPCPSPPLFNPFPKVYTKTCKKHGKTRGNGGRGGPPNVENYQKG